MPHVDVKALTLMVLSAASGTIQAPETLLVLAGGPSFSPSRPSKRRVETQDTAEKSQHRSRTRRQGEVIWDVVLNACSPSSYDDLRTRNLTDFQRRRNMFRSSPISKRSSSDSNSEAYFEVRIDNKAISIQAFKGGLE
jgi:hypothetical protein